MPVGGEKPGGEWTPSPTRRSQSSLHGAGVPKGNSGGIVPGPKWLNCSVQSWIRAEIRTCFRRPGIGRPFSSMASASSLSCRKGRGACWRWFMGFLSFLETGNPWKQRRGKQNPTALSLAVGSVFPVWVLVRTNPDRKSLQRRLRSYWSKRLRT